MRAGQLLDRVSIQFPATGQDEYGEPLTGWTDVVFDSLDGKIAAAIKDLTGRQFLAAQATQNSVSTTVTIRHRPGIVAAMRVLHGSDAYDIQAVLVRDRVWMDLMCVKGVILG